MVDLAVQLVAYGSCLLAAWLAGHKSIWAPIVSILSFVPWAWMSLDHGLPGLVAFDLILTGLSVRQLVLWRKDSS